LKLIKDTYIAHIYVWDCKCHTRYKILQMISRYTIRSPLYFRMHTLLQVTRRSSEGAEAFRWYQDQRSHCMRPIVW